MQDIELSAREMRIGDVTRPLVPAVIDALHAAVEDQAKQETFHGYGDEQGYGFLHEAVLARGLKVTGATAYLVDETGGVGPVLL